MTAEDEVQPAASRSKGAQRIQHWGNIAAGFSAACALAVSAYTAYLQRQQVRAQVWPILSWGFSATTGTEEGRDAGADAALDPEDAERRRPTFSFDLKNQGVGPAVVRAMTVTYEGKPLRRWDELVGLLASHFPDHRTEWEAHISLTHGRVIAAGESTKPFQPFGEDEAKVMYEACPRIAVKLCYCSVLDDCWEVSAQGFEDMGDPVRVPRCDRPAVAFEQ